MGDENKQTPFSTIYDSFLSRVTSDMYLEMTEADTYAQLQSLLLNSLERFKLPRFDIFDYEEGYFDSENEGWVGGHFNSKLTLEEINIISLAMVGEWVGQQLATTELTRMKYTSADFKQSSAANHMAKLKNMKEMYEKDCKSLQDIYKRRKKDKSGAIVSTLGQIMATPNYGYKIED